MARYKSESGVTLETEDPCNTGEDVKAASTLPGEKLHRWIALSFGVLCIMQAALNISLRLTIYSLQNSSATEREDLKRQLDYLVSQQVSLTIERNNQKAQLDYLVSQQNSLTAERELKGKLNGCARYAQQEWLYFSGSFYYISTIKKSWQGSRDDCLQRGADLVIINSEEEQDFATRQQKILWIGLNKIGTEKVWKWVDGTLLEKSYWYKGEPNDYEGIYEGCAELREYSHKHNWNDVPCTKENLWICEWKLLT